MKKFFISFIGILSLAVIIAGCFHVNKAQAVSSEIWLSAGGNGTSGDGTIGNPYDASTQAKFDNIFSGLPTTPMTIHLLAGAYYTYNGITIQNGWQIIGAGMDTTTLKYTRPIADGNGTPWTFGVISSFLIPADDFSNMEVSDLTIDAGGSDGDPRYISGVVLRGKDNNKIERVRVTNASSGPIGGFETFILYIVHIGAQDTHVSVIRDSVVDNCHGTYCTDFTIHHDIANPYFDYGDIIERNKADGGQFGIAAGAGSKDLIIRNNDIKNVNSGINFDTGKIYNPLISGNSINARQIGLIEGSTGHTVDGVFYPHVFDGFVIDGNTFTAGLAGLRFQGSANGPVTNTTIKNNTINGTATNAIELHSLDGSPLSNTGFTIQDNIIKNSLSAPGLAQVAQCVFHNLDQNGDPYTPLPNTQSTSCLDVTPPTLSITTTSPLPNATVGSSYPASINGTGGLESYIWSTISGALPSGLSLNSDDCFSSPCQTPVNFLGVPTTAGTYTFTIRLVSGSLTKDKSFTLRVNPINPDAPVISSFTASPTSITTGQSSTLSWSVTNATSLSINQSIGSVTGLSTKSVSPSHTTTYTLTAQNSSGSVSRTATVTIGTGDGGGGGGTPPPPTIAYKDGTLVNDHGTIYIIEYSQKRGFPTMAIFTGLGFKLSNIIIGDLSAIPNGLVISDVNTRHTRGTLIVSQGTVYFMGATLRYPYPSAEVFLSWDNRWQDIVLANQYDTQIPVGPIAVKK